MFFRPILFHDPWPHFKQNILLLQYLMEFNSTPGDLMELSPLFSDDSRVAEAASIAQKLRKLTTFLSHGINTLFSSFLLHLTFFSYPCYCVCVQILFVPDTCPTNFIYLWSRMCLIFLIKRQWGRPPRYILYKEKIFTKEETR